MRPRQVTVIHMDVLRIFPCQKYGLSDRCLDEVFRIVSMIDEVSEPVEKIVWCGYEDTIRKGDRSRCALHSTVVAKRVEGI